MKCFRAETVLWYRERNRVPRSHFGLSGLFEGSRAPRSEVDHFETQRVLLRSNLVLNAALKQPGVSELPSIKHRTDPIAWLQQNLEAISLKDSELLQVSLAASSGASAGIRRQ